MDGRVGRRALLLALLTGAGCVGEQVVVGRVGASADDDRLVAGAAVLVAAAPIGPDHRPPVGVPESCDLDQDGHDAIVCGGDDCDDRAADVNPDVEENEDWTVDVLAEDASLPALAVDRRGVAHVAYRQGTGPDATLVYATNISGSWLPETVDTLGETSHRPDIAIDAAGRPQLCWTTFADGTTRLGHASNVAGQWHETVDTWHGGRPTRCSIAVDPRGGAHLAFQDPVLGVLRYSTNTEGRWQVQTVDVRSGAGAFPHMLLDDSYLPRIGYQDGSQNLAFAARAGDDLWRSEVVEDGFAADDVYIASFALDAQGAAHASYRSPLEHELRYGTNATGLWVSEPVDGLGYSATGSALGVDEHGVAHVAYSRDARDGRPEDLAFATRAGGTWSKQTIDEEGRTGWGPSLVVGATLLHVAYFRVVAGGEQDVMYATRSIPDAVDADCDGQW